MSIHGLFIPVGREHVAATLVLPAGPARGLAVLLQGFGAMRSHRNGLWTKTSAALSEIGIASVRLDYPGLGDSTGDRVHGMHQPPISAVSAVVDVALEVTGLDTFCVVGNCLGARTALLIAKLLPGCIGVGLILPGDLESITRHESSPPSMQALKHFVRRTPGLHHLARKAVPARARRGRMRLMPEVDDLMATTRVLFLFIGPLETWEHVAPALVYRSAWGHSEEKGRVERVAVPAPGSNGLQPLSSQETVLRVIPDWVDRTISGVPHEDEPASHQDAGLVVQEGDLSLHIGGRGRARSARR